MTAPPHLPLTLQKLSLSLSDKLCLAEIDLRLETNGVTVVMGANGAGKTLLLKSIAGLITPSSGGITWNHKPEPPVITWVPTSAKLLNLSVRKNLLHVLRYHQHPNAEEICSKALQWAGIESLSEQMTTRLSTGEQQLVALARAWSLSPKVLILDEPTANLDPQRQQQVSQLIRNFGDECKIILSSHTIEQARLVADDIVLLNHGKLVCHLDREAFFSSHYFNQLTGLTL